MDNSIDQSTGTLQEYNQSQQNQPQQKPTGTIRKIFNTSSWFVFFALLPVTVLILLSQNTIPGDLFYPIKRGMENVVLAAASVNPATRVAFRTDLTERRFDEAEKLLLARADITGLSDFIEEVQAAQQEVATISNEESKKDLSEKLIKKIDEYQSKLVQVRAKTETTSIATLLPTNTPVSLVTESEPTSAVQPTSASLQNPTATPFIKIIPTKIPGSIPFPTPTAKIFPLTPSPISVTQRVTPTSIIPTVEQSPTKSQTSPSPTSAPLVSGDKKVGEAIDDTQKRLDEIKDKLKEGRQEKVEKEKKIKEKEESTDVDIKDEEEEKEKNKGKK